MRLVFGLVLILGVGLAGFAVKVAMERFEQYQAALAQQQTAIVPTTQVFVVTRQLRYGERLTPADVQAVRWPADFVPFGAFTEADAIFPPGEEGSRTVLRTMEQHEPLLISKVTGPGEDAGVASRLEAGTRAFTLQIDVIAGVSGFLRPGDRVDVYWTGTGRNGESVTRLLRSSLQIMALDQTADEERNNPIIARTITFAAQPEDIAALTQAQAAGRLTLALVGLNDETEIEPVEVSRDALLGAREEVAEAVEGPRICTVRQRNGADVVVVQVPCTN
ncbi:Flp pilus assembly protein CpaB [Roseicyclus persicicus]|uniref:Flp pilus assembly protein CpaB n=1 Tax=Roseicyclus persicicus TaxID=2650661 RepID=A0A7X6GXG0_9RHOB|nr:Flp pilus assembly protein CpaB [Roseibacterium persicicum]NKX44192.1 Flp pilus assembly protein CpaB [Roseibacterium persicicum]